MADTAVKIPFQEAAAPSTPASTKVVIYAKSDGLMYSKDDAGVETLMSGGAGGGSVATDAIWDAAGDLAVGTGSNTAARLAIGATNGMALQRVSGSAAWALPPGYEFDYAQITSNATVSATTEAGATTIVTGNAVTYDGSTVVMIEFFTPNSIPGSADSIVYVLFEDGSTIGFFGNHTVSGNPERSPIRLSRRLTPTNASHTYSIRGFRSSANGTVTAGAGGSGAYQPAYIRITKV